MPECLSFGCPDHSYLCGRHRSFAPHDLRGRPVVLCHPDDPRGLLCLAHVRGRQDFEIVCGRRNLYRVDDRLAHGRPS